MKIYFLVFFSECAHREGEYHFSFFVCETLWYSPCFVHRKRQEMISMISAEREEIKNRNTKRIFSFSLYFECEKISLSDVEKLTRYCMLKSHNIHRKFKWKQILNCARTSMSPRARHSGQLYSLKLFQSEEIRHCARHFLFVSLSESPNVL